MIRFDRYSEATWHRALTVEERARIRAAVPPGYRLHVSHGGKQYTASLIREDDMDMVGREVAPRLGLACELVLARADVVVTVDAAGWVKSIEDAS